jgi:hypothetical protein
MKLDRLTHSPGAAADFCDEALTQLGALCERTWHDRLEVVADGTSARLWNDSGRLHEVELQFPPPADTAPRDAAKEVFPGCPFIFRLAEALRPVPIAVERVVLADNDAPRPPARETAEKLWRAQFPETNRWHSAAPFVRSSHFSLLALLRCDIQAIDQHWSLRRLAVSLPDGAPDDALAQGFNFARLESQPQGEIAWPAIEPVRWHAILRDAFAQDLDPDLVVIGARQMQYLRRELERVDDYFEHYEHELSSRAARTNNENTKLKAVERLAAAKAEHARRRADQVSHHEIRALAHLEALLLIAETGWQTRISVEINHCSRLLSACFVPRARRWVLPSSPDSNR